MKAEDTVMNETLIKIWVLEFVQPGELNFNAKLKEFAQAQAVLTYRVGIIEGLARREYPLDAPCIFCGYSSGLYWQKGTHAEDCLFLDVGGIVDREDKLEELLAIKEEKP